MKASRKETAVKLTASKIGTHVMGRVVTKYGKQYLHRVVQFRLSSDWSCIKVSRKHAPVGSWGQEIVDCAHVW